VNYSSVFFSGDSVDHFLQLENRIIGEILRMQRVRDADGQTVLNIEGSLPARKNGPPLHVHFHQVEEFVVKAGSLGVQIGNEKSIVPTGGVGRFPTGVAHTWWNAGDDPLELSGRAIPARDLDRYLQAAFAVLNSSPSGKPSLFYIAHVLWRHRHTQALVSPPRLIQMIVLPLIIFVGRILGKYRGDKWPGSPASCLGAPEA
jgi:mannose-6-phosphate isomerase-like protein (cupin superfamily)